MILLVQCQMGLLQVPQPILTCAPHFLSVRQGRGVSDPTGTAAPAGCNSTTSGRREGTAELGNSGTERRKFHAIPISNTSAD